VSVGAVQVVEPGILTTVQDAIGRPGLGRYGVPPGGAMDADAARLANRLVGGRGDEPVLEVTLGGPTLAWDAPALIGLSGADLGAEAEHLRLAPGHAHRLAAGAVLRFTRPGDPWRGVRAYLAVEGGLLVESVLGSSSTDRRSGFGGLDGRELRIGDRLAFRGGTPGPLRSLVRGSAEAVARSSQEVEVRIVATPDDLGWFDPAAFPTLLDATWTVTPDSDRNGIRLGGGPRVPVTTGRIASLGVPVGSVQVPGSGEPIVTMVDGPVTGGYPVIGVVPRLDHVRLAQLAPGSVVRFRAVDVKTARDLTRAAAEAATLDRIELDPGDVAAGWAG
jgi:biotin-dependent carboxylase-like uncharacterized protein